MEQAGVLVLVLFIGIAIGGIVGALIAQQKVSRQHQETLMSERLRAGQKDSENNLLRSLNGELNTEIDTLRSARHELNADKVRLETLLEDVKHQESRLAVMGQELLKQVKQELQDEMDKDYAQKQEVTQVRLAELLKPLSELVEGSIKKTEEVEEQLQTVEKQRIDENSQLKTLVDLMTKETRRLADGGNRLADAMSNSKGRGNWGEMQLKRLLEASGLLEGVHYDLQDSVRDVNSKLLRPDVTVRFTNNRLLYIDAKTILTSLERLEHLLEETDIQAERKKHVAALEKEILSLSSKAYDAQHQESIDFVVLFVPRESMLRVALEEKPDLLDSAFHNRIILASPIILMAILRTVAIGWQEASLSQNAREIQGLAKELHKRTAVFMEKFIKIEDKLKQALTHFDGAKTSWAGRMGVMPQIQRLESYGCKSDKVLPKMPVSDLDAEFAGITSVEDVEDTMLGVG